MRILVELPDGPATLGAVTWELGNPDAEIRVLGVMADDGTVTDLQDGTKVRLDIREWYLPEQGEVPPGIFGPDTHFHRHPKGAFTGHEHEGGRGPHRHDDPEHGHRGPAVPL